jgi:hypothetical protein
MASSQSSSPSHSSQATILSKQRFRLSAETPQLLAAADHSCLRLAGEYGPMRRPTDPMAGIRRLAAAVLLQAVLDLREARDLRVWKDAEAFFFPDDSDKRERFRWALECSAIDPQWLCERVGRVRQDMHEPQSFECKRHGTLPPSEFRDGKCKKCRREKTNKTTQRAAAAHGGLSA